MKVIHLNSINIKTLGKQAEPNVMALGFFDGIHNGHRKVIKTAEKIAKEKNLSLAVMSFFPHPSVILSKNSTEFDYLMPLYEKSSILKSLNVDTLYIVKFDKEFSSLLPKEFISSYLLDMQVRHVVAGFDFSYGKFGRGNIDSLKYDSDNKIEVTKIDKVEYQGRKISSTWIRELIIEGKVEQLPKLLGRYYKTEVYYDGENLRPLSYYTLPPPGNYKAVIKIKEKTEETEVCVLKSPYAVYFAKQGKYHIQENEILAINWLYHIPIGNEIETKKSSII